MMQGKRFGLNGFALKMIALITMIIDHTGMVLFPGVVTLRVIGRLAFPIYCFLLVEGATHTSNIKKYLGRLFIFALISEIPFDLVVAGRILEVSHQNIFFTLFLGVLAVTLLEMKFETRLEQIISIFLVVTIVFVAQYLNVDYGGAGVLIILVFYVLRKNPLAQIIAFALCTILIYDGIQCYAIFSSIPILCYNGKRGPSMKYVFYIIYPVHLIILYCLTKWI